MEPKVTDKPYVHLTIDAVDAVVFDPENRFDAERYDRYPTFIQARDAALSSIEVMLDEGDYDGDDHRVELERMLQILEPAESFDDLKNQADYKWFLARLAPAMTIAA
ncbi:MAG: hypothetical protein U0794_15320 [Isosphaeraceae bacterium]